MSKEAVANNFKPFGFGKKGSFEDSRATLILAQRGRMDRGGTTLAPKICEESVREVSM